MEDHSYFVEDESGRRYKLKKLLAEGGQGAVYSVVGGRFVVKLLHERSSISREDLKQKIKSVQRLDLTGLPIAQPIAVLRDPHIGYVMKIATDMVPISNLVKVPQGAALKEWYLETGGLRRRLNLLRRCADTLYQLHTKGVVYGDFSDNNVMISKSVDENEVYFIDVDNITSRSSLSSSHIYTKLYGSPEVVKKTRGVSTLTDVFSFAILLYRILVVTHPLIGDWVRESETAVEEQALRGEIPWIDHPTDDRNRNSFGIPRDMVLSAGLQSLAEKTFNAGLNEPELRPGVLEWLTELELVQYRLLKCPQCGHTYFDYRTNCPWCKEPRPRFLRAWMFYWGPNRETNRVLHQLPPEATIALQPGKTVSLPNSFIGSLGRDASSPAIQIQVRDQDFEYVVMQSLNGIEYEVENSRKHFARISDQLMRYPTDCVVHLGNRDDVHQVIGFKVV